MEVNDTANEEVGTFGQLADHSHQFHGWLGIRLGSIFRQIEMGVCVKRVL